MAAVVGTKVWWEARGADGMEMFSACCTGVVDVGDGRKWRERVCARVSAGGSAGCGVNIKNNVVMVVIAERDKLSSITEGERRADLNNHAARGFTCGFAHPFSIILMQPWPEVTLGDILTLSGSAEKRC